MTPRARSNLLRVAIALVALAGVAYWLHERGETAKPASAATAGSADARPMMVQTAPAVRKDLPIWLDGLGTVAALQQVTVHTQVDGRLDKVLFAEGQLVKKGDVLAQIDPRPFAVMLHNAQGALARDRANRDALKRTYDRDVTMQKQNLIAQATVDNDAGTLGQAEGAILIDQSQIENAQLQLDYAQIKAPLDGIAGVRQIDAGNIVHAADTTGLVVITLIDPAAVFFTVPQERLTQVAAALASGEVKVEIMDSKSGKKLGEGKLAVLDNQVNQTTSTLRLKALIPNGNRVLWPGAFVKARALVETRQNALVVPAVAIQRGPQGTFVYVVGADATAQMKAVQVALTTGDQAVLDKGLDGGEQVVIEGQNQLRPGSKVTTGQGAGGPDGATGASKGQGGSGSGSGGHHGGQNRGSAAGPTASKDVPAAP